MTGPELKALIKKKGCKMYNVAETIGYTNSGLSTALKREKVRKKLEASIKEAIGFKEEDLKTALYFLVQAFRKVGAECFSTAPIELLGYKVTQEERERLGIELVEDSTHRFV